MTGLQRLPNGNTVMTNWLGHGQFGKAPHVIEVTPDKKVVWTFADHKTMKTISSIQLLDIPGDVTKGEICALGTGESTPIAWSPFAPRKWATFGERKATFISAPVLSGLLFHFLRLGFDRAVEGQPAEQAEVDHDDGREEQGGQGDGQPRFKLPEPDSKPSRPRGQQAAGLQ